MSGSLKEETNGGWGKEVLGRSARSLRDQWVCLPKIAALFGFTDIAAASADIARILFYIFLVIFIVLLVLGLVLSRRF